MDGCHLESDAMLAAGAMLTSGKRIPSRQLWSGRPATFMRDLADPALADMQRGVHGYVLNAKAHIAGLAEAGLGPSQD
jgi:carbonic anhydrase/acetyltransferase-like protein (isoleucine patch superfamily)